MGWEWAWVWVGYGHGMWVSKPVMMTGTPGKPMGMGMTGMMNPGQTHDDE